MKVRKYKMGAAVPAGTVAAAPAAQVVLPVIVGGASLYAAGKLLAGLVNSETGYSIGAEKAIQNLRARNSSIPAINVEANRAAANKALSDAWNKKLANGPYTINYTDGSKMNVIDYNNGYMTIEKINPSGAMMYGRIADPSYYGADLYNSDAFIYSPKKGATTRAFYDYSANGVQVYKPGAYPISTNLPASIAISRLTAAPQVVALPLEGDFYMSKKKNKGGQSVTAESESAVEQPSPTPPQPENQDPKDNQNKKKNPFKRGWQQAQNNSPEKWHNSWSSLAEKIGYGANKFWQFETSPLGVLGNMFLIGSGAGAYFGLKDNNQPSEPSQETNTPQEEDYTDLNAAWQRQLKHFEKTDSLKNNKGGR